MSAKRAEESSKQATDKVTDKIVVLGINDEDVLHLSDILYQHSNKQVEPGRIQFIAEHLYKELKPLFVVDWLHRESAIAKIRSAIRINLRKYGYPSDNREIVIADFIEFFTNNDIYS